MAQVLGPGEIGTPGCASPVDWSRWADGQWWELTRGEDFEQCAERARFAIKNWANRRGLRTNTRLVSETTLRVRVYDPRGAS